MIGWVEMGDGKSGMERVERVERVVRVMDEELKK